MVQAFTNVLKDVILNIHISILDNINVEIHVNISKNLCMMMNKELNISV